MSAMELLHCTVGLEVSTVSTAVHTPLLYHMTYMRISLSGCLIIPYMLLPLVNAAA